MTWPEPCAPTSEVRGTAPRPGRRTFRSRRRRSYAALAGAALLGLVLLPGARASALAGATTATPVTAASPTTVSISSTAKGYLEATDTGEVLAFHTPFYGSEAGMSLPAPVVGIAADPYTDGYWLVTSAGNVYDFHAPWYGSAAGRSLPASIVGITATSTGYLLVGAEGNVYNFHTPWYGSAAGRVLPTPATGIAVDPYTSGYWVTTAGGNVYNFHAPWYGSPLGRSAAPVDGIVATPSGYLVATAAGNVYNFRTPWHGSPLSVDPPSPIAGITADPSVHGSYWLASDDGRVYAFGGAPVLGSARTATPDLACRAPELTLAAPPADEAAAAGMLSQSFVLTDTAPTDCSLDGWPGFFVYDAAGVDIPATVDRVDYEASKGTEGPSKVTLEPGRSASFGVFGEDYDAVANHACAYESAGALVDPPNSSSALDPTTPPTVDGQMLSVPVQLPDCGTYEVGPVLPGTVVHPPPPASGTL